MLNYKLFLTATLLCILSSMLSAQVKLQTPETNEINSKLIKDMQNRMKWYMLKDTVKVEIAEVFTNLVKKDKLLSITTIIKIKNSPDWVDETVTELKGWKPIMHTSTNQQRDILLNFEKASFVSGYYNDKKENTNTDINEKVTGKFFDSNLYTYMIPWLPLKVGYNTEISIYDYNPKSGSGLMKAYILDTQKGTLNNKDVWIVTATDDISKKQSVSMYYIDLKTREILRQDIEAGTRKMMMERF